MLSATTTAHVFLALVAVNAFIGTTAFLYFVVRDLLNGARTGTFTFPWRRFLTITPAVSLALLFFWTARDILMPFVVAFFIAALLDPVVTNGQRKGVSRARMVGAIFLLGLAIITLAGVLLIPTVVRQIGDLAANAQDYSARLTRYSQDMSARADAWYARNRQTLTALGVSQPPSELLSDRSGPVATAVTRVLSSVRNAILGALSQWLWLIIVPLSLVYFLLDFQRLRAKLISFVPNTHRAQINSMSLEIINIFGAYVRGLAKVCCLYGFAMMVLFWLFGLDYTVFLGVASGALYAVPYVGPALALTGAVVLSYVSGASLGLTIGVGICFLAVHVTFDYVITPRVVGGSVGLHPLVNIFALMFGATVFGLWGMLLAVPVAASVKMVLLFLMPALGQQPAMDGLVEPTTPKLAQET